MRRLLLLLCCVLALTARAQTPKKTVSGAPAAAKPSATAVKAASAPVSGDKILPYPIFQKRLENGLNVVTVPYPSPGVAAFYIIVRAGSRDEIEEGKTGFAHFFEHMMFRGTKRFPKEAYSAALKSTGASANANTSLDRTVYHMTADASKLDLLFDLEADRFMNLDYSEQDFRTEAGAVKGEYTKNSSNPYTKLNEMVQNTAFDFHTYKHTTMGFLTDIIDMPNQFDYSRVFFKRFYRPEYTTILVVGDVDRQRVEALATKYFGMWERGDYKSAVSMEPPQKELRQTHLQKAGFPPFLSLNYRGPAYSDASKDVAALNILSAALFSENSALYERLVTKEQKLRGMDAGVYPTRDPFLVSVEASLVNADDIPFIYEVFTKELDKAKTIPLSQKQIDEARQNIRNSFAMSIDNPTTIAESLSNSIWITGDPESLNRYYANYDKVTAQDIMNAAKKYFVESQLTIGTISPNETQKLR
jgi:zinc protease